jgi:hypothetical protein
MCAGRPSSTTPWWLRATAGVHGSFGWHIDRCAPGLGWHAFTHRRTRNTQTHQLTNTKAQARAQKHTSACAQSRMRMHTCVDCESRIGDGSAWLADTRFCPRSFSTQCVSVCVCVCLPPTGSLAAPLATAGTLFISSGIDLAGLVITQLPPTSVTLPATPWLPASKSLCGQTLRACQWSALSALRLSICGRHLRRDHGRSGRHLECPPDAPRGRDARRRACRRLSYAQASKHHDCHCGNQPHRASLSFQWPPELGNLGL